MSVTIDHRALWQDLIAAARKDRALRDQIVEALGLQSGAPEKQLLTVAEYARRFSVGMSTVRGAIRDGRLDCEHIGRSVRIPANARIASKRDSKDANVARTPQHRAAARLGLVQGGRQ